MPPQLAVGSRTDIAPVVKLSKPSLSANRRHGTGTGTGTGTRQVRECARGEGRGGPHADLRRRAARVPAGKRRQCNAATDDSATQQQTTVQRSNRRQCNAATDDSATQQQTTVQRSNRRQCNAATCNAQHATQQHATCSRRQCKPQHTMQRTAQSQDLRGHAVLYSTFTAHGGTNGAVSKCTQRRPVHVPGILGVLPVPLAQWRGRCS